MHYIIIHHLKSFCSTTDNDEIYVCILSPIDIDIYSD